MSVTARNVLNFERVFSCEQWALMSTTNKADWTVMFNSCGNYTEFASPYAAYQLGAGVGIRRKVWTGVIASDKVTLTTPDYTLPTSTGNIDVIVEGVVYDEGVSYNVDLAANEINFITDTQFPTDLNGLRCTVKFLL